MTPPLRVRGRVRHVGGYGLAGAAVTLVAPLSGHVSRGTTGADGSYLLAASADGPHLVIATTPGYPPFARSVVVTGSGQPDADIVLTGGVTVTGSVVSTSDGPVAAATVTLVNARGDIAAACRTGADGRYECATPQPGRYTLVVSAPGHRPVAVPADLTADAAAAHDVELVPGTPLHGTVRTAAAPVRGAHVSLLDADGGVTGVTDTDDDGRYRFDDVSGGDYTLVATGYPPVAGTVRLTAGVASRRDVVFDDLASADRPRGPAVADLPTGAEGADVPVEPDGGNQPEPGGYHESAPGGAMPAAAAATDGSGVVHLAAGDHVRHDIVLGGEQFPS